ncbi:glucosamine-6-phosphate deaminase [Microbacterium xylanilyticum]
MIVHVLPNADAVGDLAACVIEAELLDIAAPVLGVATGSTPEPLYQRLAQRRLRGSLNTDSLRAFALDEYVGLPAEHPENYRRVLERVFAEPLGIPAARLHVPDGAAADTAAAAAEYERSILLAGGIDVQILGIGGNGHIGFNEPGSDFRSVTRPVELTASTRSANARFFDDPDEVPATAISQGLATILRARSIALIATGSGKAPAVRAALTGAVDPGMPASILQRHPRLRVYLDGAAAAELDLALLSSFAVVRDWRIYDDEAWVGNPVDR